MQKKTVYINNGIDSTSLNWCRISSINSINPQKNTILVCKQIRETSLANHSCNKVSARVSYVFFYPYSRIQNPKWCQNKYPAYSQLGPKSKCCKHPRILRLISHVHQLNLFKDLRHAASREKITKRGLFPTVVET